MRLHGRLRRWRKHEVTTLQNIIDFNSVRLDYSAVVYNATIDETFSFLTLHIVGAKAWLVFFVKRIKAVEFIRGWEKTPCRTARLHLAPSANGEVYEIWTWMPLRHLRMKKFTRFAHSCWIDWIFCSFAKCAGQSTNYALYCLRRRCRLGVWNGSAVF